MSLPPVDREPRPSPRALSLARLARGASYLFSSSIIVTVLSFLQGVIVVRTLGPANYGIWGVAIAASGAVRAFLSFRTQEPLTRHLVEYRSLGDQSRLTLLLATALVTEVVTALFAVLIAVFAMPWIVHFTVRDLGMVPVFRIIAVQVLSTVTFSTWYSVTRDQRAFRLLGALPAVAPVLHVLGVLVLSAVHSLTLWTLAWVYLVAGAFDLLLYTGVLQRMLRKGYSLSLWQLPYRQVWHRRAELAGFWPFMWNTYMSSSLSSLVKTGDVLILGIFRPPAEVGLYKLAKSLVAQLLGATAALTNTIYQDLSEVLASGERIGLRRDIGRLMRKMMPLAVTMTSIAMVLCRPVIELLYGPGFAGSAPLLSLLLLNVFASFVLFWAYPLVLACDAYRYQLAVAVAVGGPSLLLMVLFSYLWGAIGLAAANVIMCLAILGLLARHGLFLLQPKAGIALECVAGSSTL